MPPITRMYGDTIKVTQLYYARAAADLGSFSRAAASLGVTQPALSNGIAALEHTLGGKLFERSTVGVVPTQLGARLIPHLHGVLSSLDTMLAEARAATDRDAEPLRVGVSPLINPDLIGRALQSTRQQSHAPLVLREDNLAELQSALVARQLDVIIVPAVSDVPGSQRRRLDSEPLHYLPGRHSADGADEGEPIELADLSGRSLVMVGDTCGLTRFTRILFASTGNELHPYAGEADSYLTVEAWARLGLGGAIMPASRFRDDKATRPLYDQGQPITIGYEAVWLTRASREAAIHNVLDTIAR